MKTDASGLDPAARVAADITQLTSCVPQTSNGNNMSYTPCLDRGIARTESGVSGPPYAHTATWANGTYSGSCYWTSYGGCGMRVCL